MSKPYGDHLQLDIFGASHNAAIGMTLGGISAGLPVDLQQLQAFLERRAPGRNDWSTPRKEADVPVFTAGISGDMTNGETIRAIIENINIRRRDYASIAQIPRPGHADLTAWTTYGSDFDMSGGGPFSGRMTAPLCIAGGLCLQWLARSGIQIGAHIAQIAGVRDSFFDPLQPQLQNVDQTFPVLDPEKGRQMQDAILQAKQEKDSVGGIIECAVTGLPAGLGGPLYDGVESKLAQILYAIPAVKGVSFGLGFDAAGLRGSEHNDPYALNHSKIVTISNHCGGILGGITNGMPLLFQVAVKPTPSIGKPQQTVDLTTMQPVTIELTGRHDPCIVPRAVPVVEAAAAIAIYDLIMGQQQSFRR